MPEIPYLSHRLAATNALMHFLKTHGLHVGDEFHACRDALERGDIRHALEHAYKIKVAGAGSITDTYPAPASHMETPEYSLIVLESLVRNWCFWISVDEMGIFPPPREPIDAIGKFLNRQSIRPIE